MTNDLVSNLITAQKNLNAHYVSGVGDLRAISNAFDEANSALRAELGRLQKVESIADSPDAEPFQQEVDRWLIACFGEEIARDKIERNHRFLEEALETVQAGGCTSSEAHQLVDYVFARPVGELHQEVGGVMNTLAALCLACDLDMVECGKVEIARCWTKVEKIRAKQAAKPKHSPLPEYAPTTPDAAATIASLEERVAVAEMERKGEDAGKAAIAELLGIAGEIRWKWIRNAILDLKGRVAEAERVIAPFAYHYGSSDMRAAAKWMEAKDENN